MSQPSAQPGRSDAGVPNPLAATASAEAIMPRGGPVPDLDVRLSDLRGRPLAEHPERYQALHEQLHQALAEIDDA